MMMKNIVNYGIVILLTCMFACENPGTDEKEIIPEAASESAGEEQGPQTCDANTRASCANDLAHNGCSFTSGSHTYTGHLADEFELLLNNCYIEPLPSNCSWSGYQTTYTLYYHGLNGCCYNYNAFNFRLDQIKSTAQGGAPTNYLIIGYDVVYLTSGPPSGLPTFQVKVTYRKKGLCSLPPAKEKLFPL